MHQRRSGYPGLTSFASLHIQQKTIIYHLNNAGIQLEFSLDQPNLVARLFKELDLPPELYLYYKTLSSIRGSRLVKNENPLASCMHVAVCCAWLARLHHQNQGIAPKTYPFSFLFSHMPDPERPFISQGNDVPIIPQRNTGVDKVALHVLKTHVKTDQFQGVPRQAQESQFHKDEQVKEIVDHVKQLEDAAPCPLLATHLKSYINPDSNGAKEAQYSYILWKTANIVGLEIDKLQKESRKLDVLMHCLSRSLV